MRHLFHALSLWIALVPGTQSTQNNDAGRTDSIAKPPPPPLSSPPPIRLADMQQCPAAPKPSCDDPNFHMCSAPAISAPHSTSAAARTPSTALLLLSSLSSPTDSGRQVILAGCRCCPLPVHIECTDTQCAAPPAPASLSRVCAAEPLQGCTSQKADDRFRAAQERTAGWVWPLDKNDEAYDVDIEPYSGDEDEVQPEAQSEAQPAGSSAEAVVVSWSSAGPPPPMPTVPPLALLYGDFHGAIGHQAGLKFFVQRE